MLTILVTLRSNILFMFTSLFFLGSFLITYIITPKIIGLVEFKNLLDQPNKRSSHTKLTPTLGGIAFYFTLMLSFFFLKDFDTYKITYNIIPGLTLLFIFGLKDDLVVLSPYSKLFAQIVAAGFIVSNSSLQIITLSGFLGIYEIPFYVSIIISVFLIITIINAYNLIDGIDGLASGIGIVTSSIYAVIYFYLDIEFHFYLAISITGILLAFLRYNLSSDKKIFMGDTGSLIIGFVISIFTIKLLTLNNSIVESEIPFIIENLPLIILAILIIPLFDTARVFAIRILNKRSPFSADRNHMHHILIDLGFSHVKSSIILILFNLVFVCFFSYLASLNKQGLLFLILFVVVIFGLFAFYKLDYKLSNLRKKAAFRKRKKNFQKKIFDAKTKKDKEI